jgi:hypothetical protein
MAYNTVETWPLHEAPPRTSQSSPLDAKYSIQRNDALPSRMHVRRRMPDTFSLPEADETRDPSTHYWISRRDSFTSTISVGSGTRLVPKLPRRCLNIDSLVVASDVHCPSVFISILIAHFYAYFAGTHVDTPAGQSGDPKYLFSW